jgi:hypothetical protein
MSDFDPNDVIEEKITTSDFDAEDIMGQEETSTQMVQPEESALSPIVEQITTPAAGYMAGRTAQEAISKTGELAERGLEKIAQLGGTSPEQLKAIKQNFPAFRATDPIAEMNKLLEAARGTNVGVNQMYSEAEKLLADKVITPDEYKGIVERAVLEQNQYDQPTFAKPISQSEVSKTLQPSIESTQEIIKSKEEKLLKEFAELKAREAVAQESQKSLGQLPKETAEQITKTTKEQILQNPQAFDFKGVPSSEVLPIFEQERGKLISGKETSLAKEFPSLKGTSIVPAEEKAFQKILGMPSKADIPGNRLQEMLREFRDIGFTEQGQLSDKPAAAMSTKVREKIAEMSPEAGKLMEAENVELNKLESLEKAGYVKREGAGLKTSVEMTDAQRNKLIKDLATVYDSASPTDVVENLQTLKDYLPEVEFKKLQLAGLKLAEKRGGGVDYINANKINAILQSITKRSVARGVATLPEAVTSALPLTSMATKMIGKGAFKALPVLGAGIGGIAAQAAEEALDPETSGATPDMPEYWLERGVRDPEEQTQRARLASFKQDLPEAPSEIPSRFEAPEVRQRKEQALAAKKVGALAPTYVEASKSKVLKTDNPVEIASITQAMSAGTDKASQEYSRVLSQVQNATPSQKEAILFGLNQQPEFRRLVRKAKGEQNTED